ncbi:hypothetical protein K2Z83_26600 [Oscillochloris sp. ZM17-4]|uniref:hypothetical protein n=1 Tax=Oscillochloris sp. ZM17-4 TaxID=2866714 RepID=UPI001C736984|nr:hypothetical protein [Oscillochloris sp. ZM17-4]MBX0331224.1 hypothetical protein [Oscillochloris sp. ZM17-4]
MLSAPTFADVLRARRQIRPYLARTPLHRYPALDELIGTPIFVKQRKLFRTGGL